MRLAHTKIKLYILIDEYDNFTNTILAESGLNAYNELCHGDYYAAHCGFDAEKLHDTAIRWYDNYRFGSASAPSVANTTSVLAFFSYIWRVKQFPPTLIDENLRTDYAKIRHLVTLDRRLNGNFHVLENLIAE